MWSVVAVEMADVQGNKSPGWARAVLFDALVAIGSYLMAYRLRFAGAEIGTFLPTALRSLPLVVCCQVAVLALAGLYRFEQARWMLRLLGGAIVGTLAGATATRLLLGFEGISRVSFAVDGLLLALSAFAWRGADALRRLARRTKAVDRAGGAMVDRSESITSFEAGLLGIFRYRELLKNLVLKDLKLKYRGSVFGFIWSLVNPLLMIAVYTVAFTYILRVHTEGFVFLLLVGILAWTFFASSATMSTASIVESGGLVKSVFFPRAILPIATVLFNLCQYLLTLLVLLPIMLAIFRVPVTSSILLFPIFLSLQILFTIGVALALSTGTTFFRDIRHLLEIALSVTFWLTPIVYELRQVPEAFRTPILLSPMSPFVVAYQQIFYYQQRPDAAVWLLAVTYAAVALLTGTALLVAYEDRFAEQV